MAKQIEGTISPTASRGQDLRALILSKALHMARCHGLDWGVLADIAWLNIWLRDHKVPASSDGYPVAVYLEAEDGKVTGMQYAFQPKDGE